MQSVRTVVKWCSICRCLILGHGYDAQPVKEGRCCGNCYKNTVIPRRLAEAAQEPPP